MTDAGEIDVNKNFSMPFLTFDIILEAGWKLGETAAILYVKYIKQSKRQHTNQPYCNDAYMIKWLKCGRNKFYKVKKILTDLWLIETIRNNSDDKTYIKINYLQSNEKTKALIEKELSSPFYTDSSIQNEDTKIPQTIPQITPWENERCIQNEDSCTKKRDTKKRDTKNDTQMLKVNKINAWSNKDKCFPEVSDETPAQSSDVKSTELDDDTFMFNDGSIEFYTHSVLQQTKLEDKLNILRPLFPHLPWYKGSKKDTLKALKQFTLDHDFVYNLIYDMKLLAFQCEYWLVKRQWFMSQRVDTYTPLSEKERNKQLYKIIEYIKRHKENQSVFEARAQEMIKFIGYPKYHEVFRSIPANVWDRVILDLS